MTCALPQIAGSRDERDSMTALLVRTEMRKDPVSGRWILMRGGAQPSNGDTSCPFCPGHEAQTPPEISAYRTNGDCPAGELQHIRRDGHGYQLYEHAGRRVSLFSPSNRRIGRDCGPLHRQVRLSLHHQRDGTVPGQ